jgi:hypothetical protein
MRDAIVLLDSCQNVQHNGFYAGLLHSDSVNRQMNHRPDHQPTVAHSRIVDSNQLPERSAFLDVCIGRAPAV